MKVKFTLEEKESKALYQALKDIPINLCDFVDCPDVDGDICAYCPMRPIEANWDRGLEQLCQQTSEALKKIEG